MGKAWAMIYKIEYSERAVKQIKKLDKHIQALLKSWIDKNLIGTSNPRQHGKSLTANKNGQWRYRIGDYRLLAEIQEERVVILVLEVGHRREVYK